MILSEGLFTTMGVTSLSTTFFNKSENSYVKLLHQCRVSVMQLSLYSQSKYSSCAK